MKEICKLIEYPDRQIKPIVYAMARGFRSSAQDYLCWKNVSIISKKKGQVIAVKLLAHAYEPEEMLYFHNARSL